MTRARARFRAAKRQAAPGRTAANLQLPVQVRGDSVQQRPVRAQRQGGRHARRPGHFAAARGVLDHAGRGERGGVRTGQPGMFARRGRVQIVRALIVLYYAIKGGIQSHGPSIGPPAQAPCPFFCNFLWESAPRECCRLRVAVCCAAQCTLALMLVSPPSPQIFSARSCWAAR